MIVDTGTKIIFIMTGSYGSLTFNYWDVKGNTPITSPPQVSTFPLSYLDDMREYLLANLSTSPVIINAFNKEPYKWALDWVSTLSPYVNTQEGLPIKTYQSDLFNNWLSTEWIDGAEGITAVTSIDTSGGSFTLDTLNLSRKVYDMLNRIAVSGGTYNDWVTAVYDHDVWNRAETPVYCGGLIKELVFQEVISRSQSDGTTGDQPLGTLAGRGVMSSKHKGGSIKIKSEEPGIIMGIISLTPGLIIHRGIILM